MKSDSQISYETILTGRIYPAIQNCVNNRYKIIAGYIAIIGFLIVTDQGSSMAESSKALWFLPAAFVIFIALNSCNYYYNTKEQLELENEGEKVITNCKILYECRFDIVSSIVMTIFVLLLYCFLK